MTIIPAPAGFRLLTADRGETGLGDDPAVLSEVVIAFQIRPALRLDDRMPAPVPITPTGAPDIERPWLLIHPDGKLSMGGDGYGTFAEWKDDMGLGA